MERWKELVSYLLKQDDYCTLKSIGMALSISQRTVQNVIREANMYLKDKQIQIETKPHVGIRLCLPKDVSLELLLAPQTSFAENHEQEIIRLLCETKDGLTMDELAQRFFVSRETMKLWMKKIRKILGQYRLQIDHRSSQGMKIQGSEENIRHCLTRNCLQHHSFPANQNQIRDILLSAFQKYHFHCSDIALDNLTTHLYIAVQRIKQGHYITSLPIPSSKHLAMASEIIHQLDVPFPEEELHFFLIHIDGLEMPIENGIENQVVDQKTYAMVLTMLEAVRDSFHIDLRYDFQLTTMLALHLVPFQVRLQYHMPSFNPMADEIRTHYPLAYSIATVACNQLDKCYHHSLNVDEIAYIALHFNIALERMKSIQKENILIVCNSGRATAALLSYQLQNLFADRFRIVDVIGQSELADYPLKDIRYILTTVPLHMQISVPIIELNSFLTSPNLLKLDTQINKLHEKNIFRFFQPDCFYAHLNCKTKEEALRFLCEKAIHEHGLPEEFCESVFAREKVGHTTFGHKIAIPHPLKPIGSTSVLLMAVLEKPLMWDDTEEAQIVFLLSMKESGDREMMGIYKIISKFLNYPNAVHRLIKDQSYATLLNILDKLPQ